MQKITPHLWFNTEAKEATEFYTSLFPDSKVININIMHNTPSGDCDIVSFELAGQKFMAISAGPYFKFNPSVSLLVYCDTAEEVNELYAKLADGGSVLMALDTYPFSERYAWISDQYGLSWQLYLGKSRGQKIAPTLMFVSDVCGKAEEAINFYLSIFPDAKLDGIMRYGADQAPDQEGTVAHASFWLCGGEFGAMDSAREHNFTFNEAISFIVKCHTQEEIDRYWEALSAVPESEQCGWLKDKYGVSWQIVPTAMDELMNSGDEKKIARVTEAFLKMKKFDIAELQKAADNIPVNP